MKNESDEGLEELFRKAFESAETEPSFIPWAKVSKQLRHDSRRRIGWLAVRYTAAACLAGLLLLGGKTWLSDKQPAEKAIATHPEKKIQDKTTPAHNKNQPAPAVTDFPATPANSTVRKGATGGIREKKEVTENKQADLTQLPVTDRKLNQTLPKTEEPEKIAFKRSITALNAGQAEAEKLSKQPNDGTRQQADKPGQETRLKTDSNSEVTQNQALAYKNAPPIAALTGHFRFPAVPVKEIKPEIQLAVTEKVLPEQQKKQAKGHWMAEWNVAFGYFQPHLKTDSPPNPGTAYSSLSVQNTPASADNVLNNANTDFQQNTFPAFSVQMGLSIGYQLSRRWNLRAGLSYRQDNSIIRTLQYNQDAYGEKYPTLATVVSGQVSPAALFDVKNGLYARLTTDNPSIRLENQYRYLSLPLTVQYRFLDKRIGLSGGTGLSADFFLLNRLRGNADRVKEYNFTNTDHTIYKPLSFSLLLNLRADYRLGGRWAVFAEPYFRKALSSYSRTSVVQSLPQNWGINTGLQYRF